MDHVFQAFIKRLKKEEFQPTWLSIIVNPVYIIRRDLYKTLVKLAPKISGDILDFGCGSKPYKGMFQKASSYIGVDIEQSGHDHKNSNIDVYYDGKQLPFDDASFDAVVCFETLEHVFNVDEVLKEIKRILKPNGKLLISIPFAYGEHEEPYDFARYTSFGIKHILSSHNLTIEKDIKTTNFILSIFQLFIVYLVRHIFPTKKVPGFFAQLFFIFPLNLFALILNLLLPKRVDYFSNIVILAIKNPE